MKKLLLLLLLSPLVQLSLKSQVAVTSSTGTATSASYGTLDSAITAINGGVKHTGTITVNVSAGHTETIAQKIVLTATGTAANPIVIKKNGSGTNPLITSYTGGSATTTDANQDGIFALRGSDYVTIDGIDLIENSSNSGNALMEYGYGLFKMSDANGAQNNTIKNCVVTLSTNNFASGTYPAGIGSTGIGIFASTDTTVTTILLGTAVAGGNSNNKIYSNTIKNCHQGIHVAGANEVSPYTYADVNNDVGGNSAATGNTVLNFGGGSGSNTLSCGIRSAYQYDFNVSYNTINNNDGSGVNHTSTLRGILVAIANEANSTINNNTVTLKVGATSAQAAAIETGAGTAGTANKTVIQNNTIKNCELSSTSTGGFLGVFSAGGPAKLFMQNNKLVNTTMNATSGTFYGFYNQGGVTDSLQMVNNTLDSLTYTANTSSASYINWNTNGAGATSAALKLNMDSNTVKNMFYTGTTGGTGLIYNVYNTDTALKSSFSNNILENLNVNNSGTIYFIFNTAGSVANGERVYDNNAIMGSFTRSKAGGTFYGISETGTQLSSNSSTISNNDFSNIKIDTTGSSIFYGINTTGGVTPFAYKKIFNNKITSVINGNSTFYGIYVSAFGGVDTSVIYNNRVEKVKTRSTLYGYFINTTGENLNFYNNIVDSMSSAGASYGIYCGGGSTASTVNYYNNLVRRIYGYSTATVYGMFTVTGLNLNLYNNIISDLRSPFQTSATAVTGIWGSSGTNVNIYNNTIELGKTGQLTSTNTIFGVAGIYYPNSTTSLYNIFNNIIWIDAIAKSTGFNACIKRASGTANVVPVNFTANNNIYYINSNANNWLYNEGTSNTANNNGFASSAVTAVPARNLNVDASFNSPCGLYKRFMVNKGESSTTTEDNLVSFSSTLYRPSTSIASTAESGALPYALTNNKDYLGNARNTTNPDIGALEFSGIISDKSAPVIAFTPIASPYYCSTAPTLKATITDVSGVNTTAGTKPRLYYKKSTDKDSFGSYPTDNITSFNGWKYVEATGTAPNLEFVADYSLLTSGFFAGQTLQYFVIAQDNVATPNVASNFVGYPTGVCPTSVNLGATAGPTAAAPVKLSYLSDTFSNISPKAIVDKKQVCFSDSVSLSQSLNVSNVTYQWQADTTFGTYFNLTGATSVPSKVFINKNTNVRLQYFCGATLLGTSRPDTIIANKPAILTTKADTFCGLTTTKLYATKISGSEVTWYDSAMGGNVIGTGDTIASPLIDATTNFYASSKYGKTSVGGRITNPSTGSALTAAPRGLQLTAYEATKITKIKVLSTGAASTITLQLYNAAGTVSLQTVTGTIAANAGTASVPSLEEAVLSAPIDILNAGVYRLFLTAQTAPLIYEFSGISAANFPYSIGSPSVMDINGSVTAYTGALSSTTYYYFYEITCGSICESPRVAVKAFGKTAPSISLSVSDTIICEGSKVTLTGSSISSSYKYGYLPSGDTGAIRTYSPITNTTYTLKAVDSSGGINNGCKYQVSKTVVVKPNVPAIVVTKTKDSICNKGDTLRLNSTLSQLNNQIIYSENFNGTAPGWTKENASTGGTPASADWTLQTSPTLGISSNDATKFYLSNSDAQGSGGLTRTILVSPKMNLTNASNAFFRYFTFYQALSDSAIIEGSTDSINWLLLKAYTTNQGAAANFINDSVSINAYSGASQVWFRFRYRSSYGWYYAVDNVSIIGKVTILPTWSPMTNLFTDAATSSSYIGTAETQLYAKPTVSTNYVATVTNTNGCFRTDTAKIYVAQPVTIVVKPSADQVCKGSKYVMKVRATNANGYQWMLNGVNIVGATDTLYTINNASVADSGNYSVRIKGLMPCADSVLPAVLIDVKGAQVNITGHPMAMTVCESQLSTPIALSVTALNASSYQWTKNGGNISGANAASFSITNPSLADSGNYSVKVLGIAPCGDSTSNTIKVSVTPKVQISVQPKDTAICNSGNISFSLTATNASGYQWRKNGIDISGATMATYIKTSATIADTGNYDVVITGLTPCSNLTSTVARFDVATPISIIKQPKDTAVCVSSGQTFSVVASNVFQYQWKLNNVNIAGANNSTLTLSNVSSADTGKYVVILTAVAPCPVVSSDTVSLQTVGAVVINTQPSNQTSCENSSATFSISASNAGGYQWRKNGANIAGATASSYTISSIVLADSGNYDVLLSDTSSCGNITSATAKLTVNALPTISTQPTSQVLCANDVLTLSVTGLNALSYQWRKAGVNISGAIASSYSINPVLVSDAGLYDVVLKGKTACTDKTSNSVSVSVSPKPAVTVQPIAQTVCANGTATFSITANNAISYQWRRNGVNITGATTATYTQTSATTANAGSIDVVITGNSPCASVTSSAVAFVVNTTAAISTHPVTQSLCEGSVLNLSVTASNATAYQWRKNGTNIAGATASSYILSSTTSTNSGNYDVVVSSAAPCAAVTSNVAVVTVNKAIQVTTKPQAQTLCVGNSMTLSIAANNQAGYQWYQGNSLLPGATSSTYTVSSVVGSNSGTYKVYITALAPCSDSFTIPVSVTINNPMVVQTHPVSQTVCEGTNVTFTSAVSFATGYQWRKNGVNIAGATSSNYSITAAGLSHVASYDVVATTSAPCPNITTNSASLAVNKPIVITAQPSATTVCVGSPINFGVTANNATAYQWQKVNVNISGATSATYTIPAASIADAAGYSVVVTGIAPCPSVTSSIVNATVNVPVTGVTQPASQTVCKGNNLLLFTGANNSLGYQWRKNGTNISGANSATYAINNIDVTNAGSYDVIHTATSPCPNVVSDAATIGVSVPATITKQPIGLTQCEGGTVNLSVSALNATTFQWRRNGLDIIGANSTTLVIPNISLALAGNYDVVINGTAPCPSIASAVAQVIVNGAVVINANPLPQTLCEGQALTLNINANNAVNYQWKKDGVNIIGATSSTFVIPATVTSNAGVYSVVANGNTSCNNLVSNNANVVINKRAVINSFPMDETICEGATLSMTVFASDVETYQWFKNGTLLLGEVNSTIVISNATNAASGDYSVRVTAKSGCPSITTPASTAIVNDAPIIVTQPLSQTACSANNINLNVSANNVTGYQWRKDGIDIAGATQTSLNLANPTAATQGVYDVRISSLANCPSKISAPAFIAIKTAPSILSQSAALVYVKQQKGVTLFVSASAASTYQWRKNGVNIAGANSSTYNIGWVVNTDYADYDVIISGEAPCAAITSTIIKLVEDNNTTGINTLSQNKGFKIENLYPNPTNGNAKLIVSTSQEMEGQLEIYNAVGQLISTEVLYLQSGSQEHVINTTNLTPGKYMVKVLVNGKYDIDFLVFLGGQ